MAEETIVAICQFGGGFVSVGCETMSYTGGEAHALDISRGMKLHDFKSEISDMFKINSNTISINCFNNKQSLIKISSDKDLEQMVDSNIDSGTIDIYISIEADNRTRVADSGTSIAEAAANVETPDSRKTSKRKTRSSVLPSIEATKPGGEGAGADVVRKPGGEGAGADVVRNTRKTTKRVTRPSVSPVEAEAMKPGGAGATKRVTRSNVSPSVEAMKTGDEDAASNPGGSTGKTKKMKTISRVSPSVKAMKPEGGGTGADTGPSIDKTNKRVTRSSVSPSVEDMKPAGQSMAEKLLRVAEKLISAENLDGSKKLALDALEYDPLVEGADQIIAVTDVLLAAQRRINNQVDWYAVLQLDPATSGRDPHTVRQHYRRLTLLLRPGRSPLPAAADASRIVADAWAVLSDPSKKALLDAELNSAADLPSDSGPSEHPGPTAATDPTFWTTCSFCFHMHQYFRAYEGRCLQCQNCSHAFLATALTSAPPVVPGTDMYYCSWGFFPLGFSSGVQVGNTSLHVVPPSPSPMNVGNLGGLLPQTDGDKSEAMGSEGTALPKKLPPATNRKSVAVVEPEAKSGAARLAAVGHSAAVVESEAKSGAACPVRLETSADVVAEHGAGAVRPVGPETSAAVVAVPESKSGAVRPVGPETSAAVVAVPESKSGAVRPAAVGRENSLAVVAEPEAKSGAARLVGPENSAAVVAEPEAKIGAARSVAVRRENSAAVVVEPEARSGGARPLAVRPEYCVGVVMPAKAAPVVLDLNEEAGFWETQDTGLMMDQDQDHDIGSFDFDLDAVDLDAAGDLLGQFN